MGESCGASIAQGGPGCSRHKMNQIEGVGIREANKETAAICQGDRLAQRRDTGWRVRDTHQEHFKGEKIGFEDRFYEGWGG